MTHDVDSFDCPCKPALCEICSECEGENTGILSAKTCWKCHGTGLVELPRMDADAAHNAGEPILVLHKEV